LIPLLQAAFLGIVQGLTEFIPVSSSGHLVLFPRLFGWDDFGLAFDVALHLGTLIAVLFYFRREWLLVIRGFFSSFTVKPGEWDFGQKLAWLIILASIPAAAAGVALEALVESHLRSVATVAAFLAAGAVVMTVAEVLGKKDRSFEEVRVKDSAWMGIFQVLALAPGMSRSGVTMSAGMMSGLDREAAARFSFMMAAPLIGGAGLIEAVKLATRGFTEGTPGMLVVGLLTSAAAGLVAIKYLLLYLKKRSLAPFIVYSLMVALAAMLVLLLS
jgi:undecaprenyl-diphosphatase